MQSNVRYPDPQAYEEGNHPILMATHSPLYAAGCKVSRQMGQLKNLGGNLPFSKFSRIQLAAFWKHLRTYGILDHSSFY